MADKYLDILRQYWGYENFRGIQREIIESICSGKDTLGLMPTGGGKSITFQVPGLALDGVCIVISPLIALMNDQIEHLQRKNIVAAYIHAGLSRTEILKILNNCIHGQTKFLYISPERIGSELFQTKLKYIKVSFITVDEAHCISQWGHDFRPSYLQIAEIRKIKPDAPVLALTATATPRVVADIQSNLNFAAENVIQMSFMRKNLAYVVRKAYDKNGELLHILKTMKQCAIVYVRSRKRSKELADYLNENGLSATYFHAGLDHPDKVKRQEAWKNDEISIMVATNAFGMGIDKPDVRTVIHYDCPDSIEAYFQEAGRAGRDGKKAYAVLLFNQSDERKLYKRIYDNYPDVDYIKDVYEHLAYYYQIGLDTGQGASHVFNIDKFCTIYKYFPLQVDSALRILSRAGYIDYQLDPNAGSRVQILIDREGLYYLDGITKLENEVITEILRNYGGLFADLVTIDEALIAMKTSLPKEQIYLTLKGLRQRHIINYIPQRKEPLITYLQDRVDVRRLKLPVDIYEKRKEHFIYQIKEVVNYATTDDICRSRQLLNYFGEKKSAECGICDVCLEQNTNQLSEKRLRKAKKAILDLLSDGKEHHLRELDSLELPERQLDGALRYLIDEEEIWVDFCHIRKS